MSLDLGAVVGRVVLEDVEFQRTYVRVTRQMADLGTSATRAASGTGTLDEGLGAVSASADKATVSLGRTTKTTAETSASETKAAAAAARHAQALTDVAAVSSRVTAASDKVQAASLRQYAAEQRAAAASEEAGTAAAMQARETARLASAQASSIAASRSLAAAQKETSAGFLSGSLGMAKSLGLLFGAVEAAKAVLDIGKQAVDFQQKMLLIKTSAGASASEVRNMSAAVLAMAPQVATSPDKLADALYHVEQNGLRGKDALAALRIGAEGAKIGMADVEDTTNTMTIAMASGIRGVGNLRQAMGFMIATVGTGDMRLKDLNEALSGGILATAKNFGVSLRDVAAVLATLGDNGVRGADAATALRMTMMGFAAPAKGGVAALASVGLQMDSLSKDMQQHGLVYAMNDLEKHMKAAGITGGKVGGFITEAFGKRAGAGVGVLMGEIDRLNIKYDEAEKGANTFASRWAATTHTAAFQFDALGARIQAAGVRFASAALPLATVVGGQLGGSVNDVIHVLGALGPTLGLAFKGAGAIIEGAAFALHGIAAALSFLSPVIKVVATAWAGMWLAQAGARAAVVLVQAVQSGMETLALRAMYAQDAMVGAWASMSGSADAAAATAATDAAVIGAAADTAAAEVDAAGEAASAGWVGIAGPIGLAAGAVLALVTMFHHSTTASKEATDAAKAYGDVLASGGGQADFVDAITKQLNDNKLPQTLAKLNTALGKTAFTGKQFTDAIQNGNPALGTLRDRLDAVIKAGTYDAPQGRGVVQRLTPAAQAASKALKDLNIQYDGLSKAAKKDLVDTKTFAGVSSSVDKVSTATHVASQTARDYAGMLGIAVDKNGIAAVSAKTLAHAVSTVSSAYDTATATGNDFLSALSTFSKSAGTAADRAALISATLKAANGDALSFVGAMNAGATATSQLDSDIASAAKSVGKSGESVKTFIASIVDLKTGTIDYSKSAAAPLITDLTSMQTAAMNAAGAMYQHELSTKGARKASDDAYTAFHSLTSGALVAQAKQLGLTHDQAVRLAKTYFGMPRNVKTLIEQEGANPVILVLDAIGKQLSYLTGHPWNPAVGVKDKTPAPLSAIDRKMRGIVDRSYVATITVTADISPAAIRAQNLLDNVRGSTAFRITNKTSQYAKGGTIPPNTRFTVGEEGWEGGVTDSQGRASIFSHAQSVAMGYKPPVGYASGTANSLAALLASMGLSKAGIAGVLGNAQIESGMRLNAYNPRENAHGLFQWEGGRWTALQALAKRLHVSATSATAEEAMLKKELSSMPGLLKTLRTTGSASNAAAAFDAIFERSSGSSRGARENAANAFLAQLTSGKLSSSAVGLPVSGLVSAANSLGKLISGGRNITSGVSGASINADMAKIEAAAAQAGGSSKLIKKLQNENKQMDKVASARNQAASKLKSAQRAVAAAVATRTQDTATFKAAGVGSFDITSAGQDANGRVTSGSLRSAQQQDVTRVRKWATDMKRLIGLKIFPADYLRELLGKGPDALQTIDAILGMSAADLKSFAANEKTIDTLSGSVATAGANKLDNPAIYAGLASEKTWAARDKALQHTLEGIGSQVEQGVASVFGKGVTAKMNWATGTLSLAVKTDESKSKHRKATK